MHICKHGNEAGGCFICRGKEDEYILGGERPWEKTPKSDRSVEHMVNWQDLEGYIVHFSWRCNHYKKCHCGLDELCDKLGIERIPYDLYVS